MPNLMPLKRVVVEVTHEAQRDDNQEIRRAVRSWHNRLFGGTVPRKLVTRLGRELFLDLDAFEEWLKNKQKGRYSGPGRPRNF